MAARRFYFAKAIASQVNPTFDTGWEQQGAGARGFLVPKLMLTAIEALADTTLTVPITTTQDILGWQFVSSPLRAQTISGTFSTVVRCVESALTANASLAVVVNLVSQDGGTLRGALFSNFNNDTEFPTTAATRIVSAQALTTRVAQSGDRIVVELGVHATGPTAATTASLRLGTSAASDFALTTALTTDLNPWCEFSVDMWSDGPQNYMHIDSNGIPGNAGIMSFGEKIR